MVIEEHARLEIILPDGRFFEVSEDNIIQNSLSVSSQCVSGNTFEIGSVASSMLSAKFRLETEIISHFDVHGAKVVLFSWFGENPPENNGQRGVFWVTSATKKADIFMVSAIDSITWLDSSVFVDNGTGGLVNAIHQRLNTNIISAADIFNIIVGEIAGLPVGESLQGLEKQQLIPNATSVFKGFGYSETDGFDIRLPLLLDDEQSDNIRDYVAWIAEYMGGFVTADENGAIKFNLFENAWNNIPETLDFSEFQQDTLEISGFSLFVEYAKVITENKTYRHAYYFDTIRHPGFEMPENSIKIGAVIENNPFVEFIYSYYNQLGEGDLFPIVEALEAYLQWIRICPFSGIYHGNHYLHLGQYIKIRDKNGGFHETTITNITWKFRGGQQIKCIGEDSRTLSQAAGIQTYARDANPRKTQQKKRSQAVRVGERMKTQINRLETKVMGNKNNSDSEIGGIKAKLEAVDGYLDEHNNRLWELEIRDFQGQIDELRARIEQLENEN